MGGKVLQLMTSITHVVELTVGKTIKALDFDMIIDRSGRPYIVNAREILFVEEVHVSRVMQRKPSKVKLVSIEDEISEEISSNDEQFFPRTSENDKNFKLPLLGTPKNSPTFVEMMKNTIEKRRQRDKGHNDSTEFHLNHYPSVKLFNNQKEFQRVSNVKRVKNSGFSSLKDLVNYVEKTRPRIWAQDKEESKTRGKTVKEVQRKHSPLKQGNSEVPKTKKSLTHPFLQKLSMNKLKNRLLNSFCKEESNRLFIKFRQKTN